MSYVNSDRKSNELVWKIVESIIWHWNVASVVLIRAMGPASRSPALLGLKGNFQILLQSKVKMYALKTTRFFHSNGLISFSVFRVNLCANIVDLWSWNTWFPSLTALLNQLRDKTRNFCIKLKRKTNYNHNLLLCTLIPKTLPLRKSEIRNKEYYSYSR